MQNRTCKPALRAIVLSTGHQEQVKEQSKTNERTINERKRIQPLKGEVRRTAALTNSVTLIPLKMNSIN